MQPHFVDMHVGNQLRKYRKKLFITQQVLADMINVSPQQIQKYETGKSRIGASRLYEFSEILNIPVAYFFQGLEIVEGIQDTRAEQYAYNVPEKEVSELITTYSHVENEEIQKKMLELVKVLSSATESKQQPDLSFANDMRTYNKNRKGNTSSS